jgi:hypothetical protein
VKSPDGIYTTTVTIGFLWFSQMREVLNEWAWEYEDFSYTEGRGILGRTFYVRGPYRPVKSVADQMEGWSTGVRKFVRGDG